MHSILKECMNLPAQIPRTKGSIENAAISLPNLEKNRFCYRTIANFENQCLSYSMLRSRNCFSLVSKDNVAVSDVKMLKCSGTVTKTVEVDMIC
jgi:hypothetical protein